jgi:prevent-host-death family protein
MGTVIQSSEAKARFSEILERVKRGEEFTITHYDQPVAKLTGLATQPTRNEIEALFARIDAVRKGTMLNPPGAEPLSLKQTIEEGRR